MTEEEIKALATAKESAEKRLAEIEAMVQATQAEALKAKEDLTRVVEELKDERVKKNEALAKANLNNGGTDVNSLIEQALQAKELERRKVEVEQAIAEFKNSKTEFQTDAAGIVFGKFKDQLSRFNLSDVNTKEQAKTRLEEIYRFVNFKQTEGGTQDYGGTHNSAPTIQDRDGQLSRNTETALEAAKMSAEKYAKLKGKYSEAMTGLGIE